MYAMNDYISRQTMLDAVEKLNIIPSIDGTGKPTPTEDFRVQFLGTVIKVPAADVVPVLHAHWKDNKNGTVSCSRCSTWFQKERVPYLRFCGYCGAKMNGDRKE